MIAGAMTAFTSAAGYANAPVGLLPGLMASGVFLAWSLEAVAGTTAHDGPEEPGAARQPWLALAVLIAVVGVTIVFQFQFQQRDVAYSSLTRRCDFGPWWGVVLTPERYQTLKTFDADLRAQSDPGDELLVFYQACGYYLFWRGGIAANSYWLSNEDVLAPLPDSTFSFYRRHRIVPTLAVHLIDTQGMSDAALQAACGGLDYPPMLVRPAYVFSRKPAGETTQEVLDRLPRE